jgi:hypothetical protein
MAYKTLDQSRFVTVFRVEHKTLQMWDKVRLILPCCGCYEEHAFTMENYMDAILER